MITISKKIEYSIIFIGFLAKKSGQQISLTEAAKKLALPYRFLGQLALPLKEAGIVESKEGKTGGYKLSEGWENKTVYDLMEALGENKHIVKCLASDVSCRRQDNCGSRNIWKRMEEVFVKEMKSIKLSEM